MLDCDWPVVFHFCISLQMEVEDDDILLLAVVCVACDAFFPVFDDDSLQERSERLDRGHSSASYVQQFYFLSPTESKRQFGLFSDELDALFSFLDVTSPFDSTEVLIEKKEKLLITLYWLRQYPTDENLSFQTHLPHQTLNLWIHQLVLTLCCKLSEWWGDMTPLLSADVISHLPAWSEFPSIKLLVDTTLLPRQRPSAQQC